MFPVTDIEHTKCITQLCDWHVICRSGPGAQPEAFVRLSLQLQCRHRLPFSKSEAEFLTFRYEWYFKREFHDPFKISRDEDDEATDEGDYRYS